MTEEERKELPYVTKPSFESIYERLSQYEDTGLTPEEIKTNYYVPPCCIGDIMWCIRNQSGKWTAQSGIVNEMFYTSDMKLMIVVKYVGRGHYGDKIFSTLAECQAKADEMNRRESR
jgi:hypothetical protein